MATIQAQTTATADGIDHTPLSDEAVPGRMRVLVLATLLAGPEFLRAKVAE